ncbi:hypothetical protein KR009_005208, partial [Drosophila setifemur]
IKMIKASSSIFLLSLAVLTFAVPMRRRFSTSRLVVPASPVYTGYPEAGVPPSVSFDLPSSKAKPKNTLPPEITNGPPDNTYGPPDVTFVPVAQPQPDNPIKPDEDEEEPVVDTKLLLDEKEEDEPQVEVKEDGTVIVVASSHDQPHGCSHKSARFRQRLPQGRCSQ